MSPHINMMKKKLEDMHLQESRISEFILMHLFYRKICRRTGITESGDTIWEVEKN